MNAIRFGMTVRTVDTRRLAVVMAELPHGNRGERMFEIHVYRNNERRTLPESMLRAVVSK